MSEQEVGEEKLRAQKKHQGKATASERGSLSAAKLEGSDGANEEGVCSLAAADSAVVRTVCSNATTAKAPATRSMDSNNNNSNDEDNTKESSDNEVNTEMKDKDKMLKFRQQLDKAAAFEAQSSAIVEQAECSLLATGMKQVEDQRSQQNKDNGKQDGVAAVGHQQPGCRSSDGSGDGIMQIMDSRQQQQQQQTVLVPADNCSLCQYLLSIRTVQAADGSKTLAADQSTTGDHKIGQQLKHLCGLDGSASKEDTHDGAHKVRAAARANSERQDSVQTTSTRNCECNCNCNCNKEQSIWDDILMEEPSWLQVGGALESPSSSQAAAYQYAFEGDLIVRKPSTPVQVNRSQQDHANEPDKAQHDAEGPKSVSSEGSAAGLTAAAAAAAAGSSRPSSAHSKLCPLSEPTRGAGAATSEPSGGSCGTTARDSIVGPLEAGASIGATRAAGSQRRSIKGMRGLSLDANHNSVIQEQQMHYCGGQLGHHNRRPNCSRTSLAASQQSQLSISHRGKAQSSRLIVINSNNASYTIQGKFGSLCAAARWH